MRHWALQQPICSRPFLAAAYPPGSSGVTWCSEPANRPQAGPTGTVRSKERALARSSVGIVLPQTNREDLRVRVAIKPVFLAVRHREYDPFDRDVEIGHALQRGDKRRYLGLAPSDHHDRGVHMLSADAGIAPGD